MRVTFSYIEMPVNSAIGNTYVVRREGEWFYITAPEGGRRLLVAQDAVAADEELRKLVREADIPWGSCYGYIVDNGSNQYPFSLTEIEPHRILIKGLEVGTLRRDPNDLPTARFIEAILQSGLCVQAGWSDFDLDGIEITLVPEATVSTFHRSIAHGAILRCFPGRAE